MKLNKIMAFCFAATVATSTFTQASTIETNNLVTAGGKPVTLLGNQVEVGQNAPDFKVVNERFAPVTLTEFKNKTVLISVVPSLDTGICSLQTKRFNEEVDNLPDEVVMLTISNDLPFAQKRYCSAEGIDKLKVLSDSVWRNFGENYGLLIKDMGLLTRSIFVISPDGKISYKEIVNDISNHPDYDLALNAIKEVTSVSQDAEQSID